MRASGSAGVFRDIRVAWYPRTSSTGIQRDVQGLARTLRLTSGLCATYLSPGWLKIDRNFDPLRKSPRFQKLVAGGK